MDYNYYPTQAGHHPSPGPQTMLNHQHDCSPMGSQMIPNGPPPMMHSSPAPPPPPPSNIRHTPGPLPIQHSMPQQQHMASHPHMQPMPPQQQPSPHLNSNYHQQPPHTPLSNSASPHPSTTPLLQQPPSRPSTGASPMHHQSPAPMNGPSPKIHPSMPPQQQQQMNHVPLGPGNGGQYSPHPGGAISHHPHAPPRPTQNFINVPVPPHHPNSSHYGHQPPPPPPPMSVHHQGPPMHPHGPSGPLLPPPPLHHHHHHPQHHHQGGQIPGPPPQQPPGVYMHPGAERTSPFYPHIPQTEYRIIELNKRLQQRPRPRCPPSPLPMHPDDSIWWERFVCEFFDDNATLSLRVPGEDKPVEYSIGRTLIPRFFRSYFEGGVIDLSFNLRNIREIPNQHGITTLNCDQTDITTKHVAANFTAHVVVHTQGLLSLDFVSNSFDNSLLIKSWKFLTRQCHEYVDRSMTTSNLPHELLTGPVTRYGLTKSTVAYLKMCMIMEPMQELMCHHRQTNIDPRACLKHLIHDKYKIKGPEDNRAPPSKRRKRKTPATTGVAGPNKRNKANSINNTNTMANNINTAINNNSMMPPQANDLGGLPNFPLASQDVLQVSEPSMLSADFGDENERRITRLENNQFDRSLLNGNNNSISPNTTNNNTTNGNNVNGSNKNQISQNQNHMNNSNNASNQNENISTKQNNHDGCNDYQSMPNNNDSNYHNSINTNNGSGNSNTNNQNNTNNNSNPSDNNNENNDTISDNTTLPMAPNDAVNRNNGNNNNNNGCPPESNNNNNDESDNSYQMSLMMNGNSNHMNHLSIKSEMDTNLKQPMTAGSFLSQTDHDQTDSEAR